MTRSGVFSNFSVVGFYVTIINHGRLQQLRVYTFFRMLRSIKYIQNNNIHNNSNTHNIILQVAV